MRTTIFIKGLPPGASVQAMAGMAEGFGRLSRVVVDHNGTERQPEAICWITFERHKDAAHALQDLDGQVMGGRRVAVRWVADAHGPAEKGSKLRQGVAPGANSPAGTGLARSIG